MVVKDLLTEVSVALVHWPVYDGAKNVVATNVTNFDIHDIARASRAYGVKQYFIVNRLKEQLMFVARVLDHWRVGEGSRYNMKRKSALEMVDLAETVEEVIARFPKRPLVIATSAKQTSGLKPYTFPQLREQIWDESSGPVLLLFGTGFGLHEDVLSLCDGVLEPIRGSSKDDYRHLSVRSAVSICLDRLLSAC